MRELENHLAPALARLLRTDRAALCRAAAEQRDKIKDPALSAVWAAIAITCAEVDDAERELLTRASGDPA